MHFKVSIIRNYGTSELSVQSPFLITLHKPASLCCGAVILHQGMLNKNGATQLISYNWFFHFGSQLFQREKKSARIYLAPASMSIDCCKLIGMNRFCSFKRWCDWAVSLVGIRCPGWKPAIPLPWFKKKTSIIWYNNQWSMNMSLNFLLLLFFFAAFRFNKHISSWWRQYQL